MGCTILIGWGKINGSKVDHLHWRKWSVDSLDLCVKETELLLYIMHNILRKHVCLEGSYFKKDLIAGPIIVMQFFCIMLNYWYLNLGPISFLQGTCLLAWAAGEGHHACLWRHSCSNLSKASSPFVSGAGEDYTYGLWRRFSISALSLQGLPFQLRVRFSFLGFLWI